MPYLEFRKGTKVRRVFAPSKSWKSYLRARLPALHAMQELICDPDVVHGFYRNRSPVTNATQHIGYDVSICMDLKDFFPSVTFAKVRRAWRWFAKDEKAPVPTILAGRYWIYKKDRVVLGGAGGAAVFDDGPTPGEPKKLPIKFNEMSDEEAEKYVAEQGLPTSPLLANIAMAPADRNLKAGILSFVDADAGGEAYTRYADDLTFSFKSIGGNTTVGMAIDFTDMLKESGFEVSQKKTRIQRAKAGRRIITGVAVDTDGIHVPRKVRRKLRAARHNGWHRKARGLFEFSKLKVPDGKRFADQMYRQTAKLLKWKIKPDVVRARLEKMKSEVVLTHHDSVNQSSDILAAIETCLALCNVCG